MIEDIVIALVSVAAGAWGMRIYMKRPKVFIPEDMLSGLERYQKWKNEHK